MSDLRENEIHIYRQSPPKVSTFRLMSQVVTGVLAIAGSTAVFWKTARDTKFFERAQQPAIQAQSITPAVVPPPVTPPVAIQQQATATARPPVVRQLAQSPAVNEEPAEESVRLVKKNQEEQPDVPTGEGAFLGPAFIKQGNFHVPIAMDLRGNEIKDIEVVPEISGIEAKSLREASGIRLGQKITFQIQVPRIPAVPDSLKPEIEVGLGSSGPEALVLNVSVWMPTSPAGKSSRTRITAASFAEYDKRIKKDALEIENALKEIGPAMAAEKKYIEGRMAIDLENSGVYDRAKYDRIDEAKANLPRKYQQIEDSLKKRKREVADRAAALKASADAFSKASTTAKLNYKVFVRDGNKLVLIGQSK